MHGVRVAEEVVHVAKDFLVRTDEEDADVIAFAGTDGVQRKVSRLLYGIDIVCDFPVTVARDILQSGGTVWTLVEALDRHNREELVEPP